MGVGAGIGSSMVHGAMGMMSGGGSRQEEAPRNDPYAAQQPQQAAYQQQPAGQANPCAYQLQDFMNCAQNSSDISMCSAFNDVYKQCKQANGLP